MSSIVRQSDQLYVAESLHMQGLARRPQQYKSIVSPALRASDHGYLAWGGDKPRFPH